MSMMTQEQNKLSEFLSMPVADGLDAVVEALKLFHNSTGQKKESARRILAALKLMFDVLAPKTLDARRWELLHSEIRKAVPF